MQARKKIGRKIPPRVTVWLSCYQHARFLRRAVESILEQTYRDFEVYAVDDCSQDGSWEILQEYAARCPSVFHIFRHPENRGGSHMEEFLERLQSEYIAIAHCDDAWAPRKLERQVAWLDAHPETAACFTAVQLIGDDGQPVDAEQVGYEPFLPESHTPAGWVRRLVLRGNCLCHPSVLARRTIYGMPGALARGLYSLPDYHRWLVLAVHGQGIHVLSEQLTCFRIHADGSNMSSDLPGHRSCILGEHLLIAETLFQIKDAALLREAFPEAETWLPRHRRAGRDEITFALAKTLLELDCLPGFRAEAARRLYGLLNRPDTAEYLHRRFGYSDLAFQRDLTRADLFDGVGRWQRERRPAAQLSCRAGGGFGNENCQGPAAPGMADYPGKPTAGPMPEQASPQMPEARPWFAPPDGLWRQQAAEELARQAARADRAEAALAALQQSRSWQMTAPLRAVASRLHGR